MRLITQTEPSNQLFKPSIAPYQSGDLAAKRLILHFEPMLRKQGAAKAKMWLTGWSTRLERIRALDQRFDDKLAAILDQPLPPAKHEPIRHEWLETSRRDDRPRRFNLDAPTISTNKRHKIRIQVSA